MQTHIQGTNQFGLVMPAQRKREVRGVEGRNERTARFEQRARDMGMTGEALVAQKVKIWEGTRVAKQNGEDIEVGVPCSASIWSVKWGCC